MHTEDEGAGTDAGGTAHPLMPIFFQPDDLPEWLRPPRTDAQGIDTPGMIVSVRDVTAAATPPLRGESMRARQAWGSSEHTVTPAETGDFAVAATTALARLVATPSQSMRKRRGLFGIGATLPLVLVAA